MYSRITSFLLLFLSLSGFSQHYTIEGTVKDENNIAIAFANVVIEDTTNYNIILGTISNNDGFFKFENVKPSTYNIRISFLGYEQFSTKIKIQENVNLKEVVLVEKKEHLGSVVITAKRPTVKRLVDRLVFDVENSTLSNSNVFDVLKQTPGIVVRDGIITIKNTTPVVYINNRRVHLSIAEVSQLLEATTANNIQSIEVITSPPAKYDAEGGAVLNINTSKNIISGYYGSVFGNYNQGFQFPKFSLGTSHFFKYKKLNAHINYNISPRKDFRNNFEDINFINNSNLTSRWETNFKRNRQSENQNVTGTINYDINKNNSFVFSANTLIAPRGKSKTRVNSLTEMFNTNKTLDSSFRTFNNLVSEKFNLALSLGYIHKFKREGEELSVDLHHTKYDFSEFQNVDTGYFLPNASTAFRNNRFQTFSSQNIKLLTGQIDYKLPSKDGAVFKAGVKAVNINSDNILDQFIFENGIREEDLNNSDVFLYDETNYAVYTSYEKQWKHWSIKAGLRVEVTETDGESIVTNTTKTNNYTNLFPSFHLLNQLQNDDKIYFSYNKRINRPRYKELNPFKYFLNDNTFITGDPDLLPEINDVFTLGYTINNTYTFEVYYRYEQNPTLQLPIQDNTNRILKQVYTNTDHNTSYGLDFTMYNEIAKRWNFYVLSSLFFYENNFFAPENINQLLKNERVSVYANIVNYFSFLKDDSLNADIGIDYISSLFLGPSKISGRLGVDINFKKTFCNNRAALNIGLRDLFNTRNFTESVNYLDQDYFVDSNLENRLLVLGFNYKFGNHRLTTRKKEINLDERDRLEKN